ncbi:MAG: MFS transporter [Pseudomonadota bacterium]
MATVSSDVTGQNQSQIKTLPEILWASGSLATGALYNAMALFSLFFMTTFLGIEAAVAGTIVLISKVFDGITDPVMGAISDRTHHKLGPRRPYLFFGSLLMGASFALFFNLPTGGGASSVALALGALVLYSLCYTVFTVPYLAMPPDIAASYDGRTRLMSFRVFFLMLGVLGGSAGAPQLVKAMGSGIEGYNFLGIVMGLLAVGMGLVAFYGSKSLPFPKARPKSTDSIAKQAITPFTDVISVLGNAPFKYLTLVKLCQLAVLAVALACTPYFFTFVLQRDTGDITLYLFTFSIVGLLSIPIWRQVIRTYGKKNTYMVLLFVYAAGMATWYLWTPGEPEFFVNARAVGIGTVSTGTLLCEQAQLPDTMEYDRLITGQSRDGTISGVFTLVEKVAGALGPFAIGILLQSMGLVPGRDPSIVQPQAALDAVKIGMSIVPALFCLAAVPFLMLYKLDEDQLEAARAKAH